MLLCMDQTVDLYVHWRAVSSDVGPTIGLLILLTAALRHSRANRGNRAGIVGILCDHSGNFLLKSSKRCNEI